MEGWKTAIERKNKTNEKWKKKVAVFVRVKGRRDQPWTITLETVKKKRVAMATEILCYPINSF